MTADAVPSEVEAKLLPPADFDLHTIARLTQVGPYRLRPRDNLRLHSEYLDTAELALAWAGIALRLRRLRGAWEVTAKWRGTTQGAIHQRPELTIQLARAPQRPFVVPDGPLRTQLAAVLLGRPLASVMITDIRRQCIDVLPAGGAADDAVLAEIALDRVQVRAPTEDAVVTTYNEIEVEQLAGTSKDIARMARLLGRTFNLVPTEDSKFGRGMRLIYGVDVLQDAVEKIAAGDTLAEAVRHIAARQLRRLQVHDPGTRKGEDAEALHDMRVAARRLRGLLRAFPEGAPATLHRRLDSDLPWLGELLGPVRDLDVQVAELERDTAAAPPGHRAGFDGLRQYLIDEREQRRCRMLAGLESRRYRMLLLQIERFARKPTRPRRGTAPRSFAFAGRRALKKALARLLQRGAQLAATPTPEDLHALRIRAKRLRYLLEFLADVTGNPGQRAVKRLVRLQDVLGAYHDAVVAADSVRSYVAGPGAQQPAATLLALGALVSRRLQRAEAASADFHLVWRRFTRRRNRKEMQRVLQRLRRVSQ